VEVVEMSELLKRLFITNWPRKLVALITAVFVWFLVNQTITITRTIPDIPIRIINLPPDKTVVGLLPNGLLNKRISITVTGSKSTVRDLRPSDLEVVINADGQKESWIATIDKRNLFNINQDLDLRKSITNVSANDIYIKMSRLITEEIPITITKPIGDPPKGFQFLDIWPKRLMQKVSGPEEQVRALKERGLEVTFNLNRITESELETLYNRQGKKEEVTYKIPDSWKKVAIPFKDNVLETINDPRADLLRIDFLKQELIPLGSELPITIFFPLKYSATINPQTYSLATSDSIVKKNGLKRLTIPLYVRDVSRLFLDVVRDNLLLIVVASPTSIQENLNWAVEFIDEKALEDAFVEASLRHVEKKYAEEESFTKYSEQTVRYRFRDYLRNLVLYTEDGSPLNLEARLSTNTITIKQIPPAKQ
jgi:hypothetical protein